MKNLQQILRQAQRRAMIDHALRRIGCGLSAAIALCILLLVLDRVAGLVVPQVAYWIIAAAGALIGVAHAIITVPDRLDLAVRLDRALHLKDRFGTAVTVETAESSIVNRQSSIPIDPEFAELVRRDATRLAETLDVRTALPIRITRIWATLVPMAALLAVGVMFLPALNWGDPSTSPQIASQQAEQVRQQAAQMAETIQQTVADLPRDQFNDERGRANLDALDRLAQQMSDKSTPVDDLVKARDESAARLTEMADGLARQSQRDLAAADEVANRFAGLEKTGAPKPPMSAKEFSEALQRGDFGEATQELEELLDDESLTSAERGEAAEHLRELASHLDDRPSDTAQAGAERSAAPGPDDSPRTTNNEEREQLADALRDQGLDEQAIQETLDNPPPSEEELQRDLQERNVDEEVARQLARDIQKQAERRQIDDQTQKTVDKVKESLREAARELESTKANQSDQPQPSPRDPSAPNSTGETPTQSPSEQPQEQQPASPDGQTPRGSQPSSKPDQSQPASQGRTQGEVKKEQQNQDSPESRPSTESSLPDSRGEKPGEQSQPTQSEKEPLSDQRGDSQPQQIARQSDQSSAPSEENQQSPPSPTETLRRVAERREGAEKGLQSAEQLRQLAREFMENTTAEQRRQLAEKAEQLMREQQQQAQNQPGESNPPTPNGESPPNAEELNQIAREMMEKMSPQERQEMAERLARLRRDQSSPSTQGAGGDPQGEPAGPGQPDASQPPRLTGAEDLDLRGRETADRIIAQWLEDQLKPTPPGAGTSSSSPPPIRNAQQVAERAVNETAVQKRYHKAIQRYFGRLNETVEKAATEKPDNKK